VIPGHVDRILFLLAPGIAMGVALLAFAVVPFGPTEAPPATTAISTLQLTKEQAGLLAQQPAEEFTSIQKRLVAVGFGGAALVGAVEELMSIRKRAVAEYHAVEKYRTSYQFVIAPNVNIGILYVFAISSLAVYGVILGGWAANNKYSFIGALRSSAQIISYEIPLGLSLLGIILMSSSLNLERIIWEQVSPRDGSTGMWFIFYQPLAFVIFLVSAFAETNRLPFDLSECEQELVGGFHTEYSGFKFGMFFLGEYTHMITTSFLMVILFFGGWHFPFIATADSWWGFKLVVFAGKMGMMILFYMLVRWTIPRFRFDQLMGLAWKILIPLALINLVMVMVVKEWNLCLWWLLPASLAVLFGSALFAAAPVTPPYRPKRPTREMAVTQ